MKGSISLSPRDGLVIFYHPPYHREFQVGFVQICATDPTSTAAPITSLGNVMWCTSAAGPRLPGVAEEGGREAAAQQLVPLQQSGQGPAPEAAATSAPGTDAAAHGAASGEAAEAAAAEPSTPLTRKRSRREAELAGAVAAPAAQPSAADSGGDPMCNTAPSEKPNGGPHGSTQFPEDALLGIGAQSAPGNAPADQVLVLCQDLMTP